jgi:hypothetical protein
METPVALLGWMLFAKEGQLELWLAAVPQATIPLDMRWDTCMVAITTWKLLDKIHSTNLLMDS